VGGDRGEVVMTEVVSGVTSTMGATAMLWSCDMEVLTIMVK